MSTILGFNCCMDDASACLLRDGEIVLATEEERFTRQKHEQRFPEESIRRCLEAAGIGIQDLDHVAFNMQPFHSFHRRLGAVARGLPGSLLFASSHGPRWFEMVGIHRTFRRRFGKGRYRFHWVRHHDTHAAGAFFASPFEEAAVLTLDGSGESASTMLAKGVDRHIERLAQVHFPHSIGYLYAAFTQFLGFKRNSGEGKVMGLASYGKPQYLEQLRDVARPTGDGLYALNLRYFAHQDGSPTFYSPRLPEMFGQPPRVPESEILPFHEDLAASLQALFEELCFHVLRSLHERSGSKRICLAGGAALNCSMNGKILANTPFEEMYVQAAASDSGGGLGAALYVWHQILGMPRGAPMLTATLGSEYDDASILAALNAVDRAHPGALRIERVDPVECGSELLAEGRCIGWFQGRSELGPRALGSRSILADPRVAGMVDHLNAKVKFREGFRPFAPSVLEEHASEWFEDYVSSPFMLSTFRARPERAARIPAVVHVDGTARVQGVTTEHCPLYHRLITRFAERTGIPLLLDTSFNLRGEPLVETPQDTLSTFLKSGLEHLVMGEHHVRKTDG